MAGGHFLQDVAEPSATKVARLNTVTANTTYVVPAGYQLRSIVIHNTTANAVTGGIRVGTTDGGADVVVAQAVGASALVYVTDATLLKQIFSMSATQTLYIQAVTNWNSASVNIYLTLTKLI